MTSILFFKRKNKDKKKILSEARKSFLVFTQKSLLVCLVSFSSLSGFYVQAVQAAEVNASQKAMKVAEGKTQGKAVSSKFMQQGGKKGYKVRILKGGKISHIFISLDQVQ